MPFEVGKLAREDMKGKAPFTKSDLSPDPIQWVNDSATLMLQYGFGELVGWNVACPGFDPECLGFGGGVLLLGVAQLARGKSLEEQFPLPQ